MDLEAMSGPIARLAAAMHDAGARPTFKTVDGQTLTLQDMHDVKAAVGQFDTGSGDMLRDWATKQLQKVANRTPVGADGEAITWAEACATEHPYVVATKAFGDPAYAHLAAEARQHMAASPARASLGAVHLVPGEIGGLKAAENHTGAMVALIPSEDDLDRLAPLGTEDRAELHCTLYYPGQVDELDEDGLDKLLPRLRQMASVFAPVKVRVAGVAMFNPTGDNPAHVLVLNSPSLQPVKDRASRIVEKNLTTELVVQHEPFIPHVTLQYGGVAPMVPPVVFDSPLVLDRLRLAWGSVDIDMPLTGES